MSTHRKSLASGFSALALVGMIAGAAPAAMAADDVSIARKAGLEVATRAPHKASNPFHRRHVISETAEFARLEIATEPTMGQPSGRPLVKSGNRFHPINR